MSNGKRNKLQSPHRWVGSAGITLTLLLGLVRPSYGDAAKQIAKGDYHAPIFSPDSTELLVRDSRMASLRSIDVSTEKVTRITKGNAIASSARYLPDGTLQYSSKRGGLTRLLHRAQDGSTRVATPAPPVAFAHKGRIYLNTSAGPTLVSTGDSFFAPTTSPDGSKVAFTGLTSGIFVYFIATGKTLRVGTGTAPSWSPDSSSLVYEWTDDDGHVIVSSDLWIWNRQTGSAPLTQTQTRLERHPSFSPNGKQVVFDDSKGAIFLLPLGESL